MLDPERIRGFLFSTFMVQVYGRGAAIWVAYRVGTLLHDVSAQIGAGFHLG